MPKRKFNDDDNSVLSQERNLSRAVGSSTTDFNYDNKPISKHSLDSDEEDDDADENNYNVMHENDMEGVEDGPMSKETKVGFTAFNMKEELEEGHFDKDGHYLWKKEKQIRDNWLDNIDWVKVDETEDSKNDVPEKTNKGLGDSDSDDDDNDNLKPGLFDPTELYKQILEYLQPKETVSKALCRLGKGKKQISSSERWKRKKAGLSEIDENSEKIIKLTELSNELLTRTGNMDIYQETYETIKYKISQAEKHSHPAKHEAESDMFADDFDSKATESISGTSKSNENKEDEALKEDDEVKWELKWSQNDDSEINGPHTTEQMHKWAEEGYFKKGAWVRRVGQTGQFYSAARVDFELYL